MNMNFMMFDGSKWSPEENKVFEDALALYDKETPDRWHNVARMIPGKTVTDVMNQYRKLEQDISEIEAGAVTLDWLASEGVYSHGDKTTISSSSSRGVFDHDQKKKGIPWTQEEHRQFLLGLNKYGKGDWRNISRNFVTSRTPTQVASHAQKYFIRQLSGGKDKRRSSIHDITTSHLHDTTTTIRPHETTIRPHETSERSVPPQLQMYHPNATNIPINMLVTSYGPQNGQLFQGYCM